MTSPYICSLIAVLLASTTLATERIASLQQGFLHPPASARPWIFWFWLNGNITSNGITADLEAMQHVGIGGVIIMDVDQGVPQGPIAFGSPAWINLFKHVCGEANRLGLQVNMNDDAGWAGSGGPWIPLELSMQKLVWSETTVKGPSHFEGTLPQPKTLTNYYRDIAVFALPVRETETAKMKDFSPKLTASVMDQEFDPKKPLDGDEKTAIRLPRPEVGKPQFIQLEFPEPFRARRLKLILPGLSVHKMCQGTLQISEDGQVFKNIRQFDANTSALSINFDEVVSRFFRVEFSNPEWYLEHLEVAEVELSPQFRIDDIEAKASFVSNKEKNEKTNAVAIPEGCAVTRKQIAQLSSRLRKDGHLTWDVPPGTWTILRFGHTSTGEDNQPAPISGRGLECDKLSKEAATAAFDGFIGKLVSAVGPLAGKTFISTHVDSWEVGSQNWTPKFRQEFERRRGYDPLPFLVVTTGRVVDSLEVSERFLWDLRQTVSDLIADNYAGRLRDAAHRHGMGLTMEAYDLNPSDDLTFAGRVDLPMGEFWITPAYGVAYSCIEMTSAAHVYGKPIVGAEAFTATDAEKWTGHPFAVKVFGDWAFCHGINRLVLHRYAHQPWTNPERAPGMSMGPWGLHYERTQTWWEYSRPWHEYLARCQYLLQQGLFVADICYLAPEQAPQKWEPPGKSKERPGYNFDGCPPEVVMERLKVKSGKLVLPDGMSYRLLVLPDSETMTPRLLRRIKELVADGATVVGNKPLKSPSLYDFPKCDAEVQRLAAELWGDCDGNSVKEHRFGKGTIICGKTPQQVLSDEGIPPDFAAQTRTPALTIRYTHRVLGDLDLYFVANKSTLPEEAICSFRVHNKRPEFWWPDTGRIEQPAVYHETNGTVRIPMRFDPNGSVFVLFRPVQKSEPEHLISISHNGAPLLQTTLQPQQPATAQTNQDMAGAFTMALWAKPEVEIDLPSEAKAGSFGWHVLRNEALFPPPGHDVYSRPGQAGSGLSIGRNGVCVFEHSDNYFAPPLVFGAPLTNWTHVAVVYRDNQPSLYLNGKFVHEGLKSDFTVHCGVGVQHRRGVGPFRGELGEFQKLDRALSEDELAQLMNATPIPPTPPSAPVIQLEQSQNGRLTAQAWEAGMYVAQIPQGRSVEFNVPELPSPLKLAGPWQLHFPPQQSAPEQISLEQLISWTDHTEPGVKYFSGTANYRKTFHVPPNLLAKDQRLYLDLGKVAVMAQVNLNGTDLGLLWKPPFRVDITGALKAGPNELEVKVINLWPNRMIGDEQLPDDSERKENGTLKDWPEWFEKGQPSPTGRHTFTTWRLWKKDSPLQQSGLIGPVTIRFARQISIVQ